MKGKMFENRTWFGETKSLDVSFISSKMFLNAVHPSSLLLPAGTIIVLRFLLTEASDTCNETQLGITNLQVEPVIIYKLTSTVIKKILQKLPLIVFYYFNFQTKKPQIL